MAFRGNRRTATEQPDIDELFTMIERSGTDDPDLKELVRMRQRGSGKRRWIKRRMPPGGKAYDTA